MAVDQTIVHAAAQILTRLDAERDAISSEWAGRQDMERSVSALARSFFGLGTMDSQVFDGFDQLVRQPTERHQKFLRLALDTARQALSAYGAAPDNPQLRRRLADVLYACVVATDAVRWDTNVATALYALFWAGIPSTQLRQLSLQVIETVTDPVLRNALGVLEGRRSELLGQTLSAVQPALTTTRTAFERLEAKAREWAPWVRKVINVLDAAMLTYGVYELGVAALSGGRGGGPPLAGGAIALSGTRALTLPAIRMFGWQQVLEQLVVVGGISSTVVFSRPPRSSEGTESRPGRGGRQGSTGQRDPLSEFDPDDNVGGQRGRPSGDPQPAPDDLYCEPVDARTAAAWERQDAAWEQAQQAKVEGRVFSSLSREVRRRAGYKFQRTIYPATIKIARGGRALPFVRGVLTRRFLDSLRGQTQRALFIETSVRVSPNRMVRFDLLEITFGTGRGAKDAAEVLDLTTSLRAEHVLGTGEYASILSKAGFRVTAADVVLLDNGAIADKLIIVPAQIP
ncbi:hypothetical protein [Streptomyces viridochromogenes]|nr:hypothetical protein [Streptomyces viridochromogenes]